MFEDIFNRKRLVEKNLTTYGFVKKGKTDHYYTDILNGEFNLEVVIDANGKVDTNLIEKENGEVYTLYKTNATGSFIAAVRTAIAEALTDIVNKCYEDAVFKTKQADIAIKYVRETYGDELEFLWTKFPDNAVWRRKDNRKWYGAILTVQGEKIGIDTKDIIEIIDLRMNPEDKEEVLSKEHYYPGWHMNKNSWFTIALDGSIKDNELKKRIDESYELAQK